MRAHDEHSQAAGPSEVLRAEHETIERLLRAMDGMAARLEAGGSVPRSDLDAALDVLVGFADGCHHAKEERVLFPALRAAGPEGERIARELEGDHMAARRLVRTLRGEAAAAEAGHAEEKRKVAHDARLYARLLRAHIDLETERLFPLADRLPGAQRRGLAEAFGRVDLDEAGPEAHERFERQVHDLHDRWAG